MNKNDLISRVGALVSDTVDGDTVLLIEQHLPEALDKVCKFITKNKPTGHELLLLEQAIDYDTDIDPNERFGHKYIVLIGNHGPLSYPLVVTNHRLNEVFVEEADGTMTKMEPVSSIEGLRISTLHDNPYYCYHPNVLYMSFPAKFTDIENVVISHYVYLNIDQFPDLLSEYLVSELVQLIQNEPVKQAMEAEKP